MNELYFVGMDIIEETKNIMSISEIICTNGMTDSELKAYRMGITNTMSALAAAIEGNDCPVIHIGGMEVPTELSIDDLEAYCGEL